MVTMSSFAYTSPSELESSFPLATGSEQEHRRTSSRRRNISMYKLLLIPTVVSVGNTFLLWHFHSESVEFQRHAFHSGMFIDGKRFNPDHLNASEIKSTTEVYADNSRILNKNNTEPSDLKSKLFKIEMESAPECGINKKSQIDFTLTIQFSSNRIWAMRNHCKQWGNHPISLAVASKMNHNEILKKLIYMGCKKEQINLHVLNDSDYSSYPVNLMRNLALSGVKTSHTFLLDVDFMISDNLYENLMSHKAELIENPKTAIVVPAFELRRQCNMKEKKCYELHKKLLPHTKSELIDLMSSKNSVLNLPRDSVVAPFDSRGNFHGHGSTLYDSWVSDETKTLKPIKCVTSHRYEPYLAFEYCKDMPPPQEAFSGYGKNKFVWVQQILRSGYQLLQINDSFVIHFPHKPSLDRKKWEKEKKHALKSTGGQTSNHNDSILRDLDNLEEEFNEWMINNIPDQTKVPKC